MTRDEIVTKCVCTPCRVAVVGASPKAERPVFGVMEYLKGEGFTLFPVNPAYAGTEIHGAACVSSLGDIASPVDVVALFLSAKLQSAFHEELKTLPDKPVVWFQPGAENEELERSLAEAGYDVVSGECLMALRKGCCR